MTEQVMAELRVLEKVSYRTILSRVDKELPS
jgi:hypothetical protein